MIPLADHVRIREFTSGMRQQMTGYSMQMIAQTLLAACVLANRSETETSMENKYGNDVMQYKSRHAITVSTA